MSHTGFYILKCTKGYESGAKLCNLCLEEKLFIMKAYKKNLLNKRSEINSPLTQGNEITGLFSPDDVRACIKE